MLKELITINFVFTNGFIALCSILIYFNLKNKIKEFEQRQAKRFSKILDIIEKKLQVEVKMYKFNLNYFS